MKDNNTSVINLWNSFLKNYSANKIRLIPESFYFCDNEKDANECVELVVNGINQATATFLWWYKKNNKSLPNIGVQYDLRSSFVSGHQNNQKRIM